MDEFNQLKSTCKSLVVKVKELQAQDKVSGIELGATLCPNRGKFKAFYDK